MDYSVQTLPTGGNTPGALDQHDLDEVAGLGSGSPDLFFSDTCQGLIFGASSGPVDWDNDGSATDRHLSDDVDVDWTVANYGPSNTCSSTDPLIKLRGFDDWGHLLGATKSDSSALSLLVMAENVSAASGAEGLLDMLMHPELHRPVELDIKTAMQHHVLLPMRLASLIIKPGCTAASKPLDIGARGTFFVTLLATGDFDPTKVDLSSLRFHQAAPVNTEFRDVNGDGIQDLVIELRKSDVHLAADASTARLSGWLKSSQSFYGEDKIRVVLNLLDEDATCR